MKFDTDNLDYTLAPILADAISQYIEAFKEEGLPKHPNNFNDVYEWLHVLEEIHWAFDNYDNSPDSSEYEFDINWNEVGKDEYGNTRVELEIVGEEESARYEKDCDEFDNRVQEGLNLFATYFKSLWL